MNPRRLHFQFFTVLLLLGGLASRLVYIQVFQGLAYSEIARRQFIKKVKSESRRGDILDRNGNILATTLETQSIFAHPRELAKSSDSFRFLAAALSLTPAELRQKTGGREDFVWLERKCSPAKAEEIAQKKIRGIGATPEQKRYYPNGILACHLIGAVGLDNSALAGVEQAFDAFLRGKSVIVDQVSDGKGRRIETPSGSAPKAPQNVVVLTIDRSLQYIVEKELQRGVEENQAESGMALIQDPRTGEILASASYPPFDPGLFSNGKAPDRMAAAGLSNPVVSKLFEPGSTFKVVTFAAALEEKKFSSKDVVDCEDGEWKIAGTVIHDHEKSGVLPLSQVLEKSSNIGTAKIGLKLGKEKLYRYARAFGFGTRTGANLPGETEGLFRHPSKWSGATLPILSFGQGIGVTALQLIGAYSAVANGGDPVAPGLVGG